MTLKRNVFLYAAALCAVCAIGFVAVAGRWRAWTHEGLTPELIFELQLAACDELVFGDQIQYPRSWPMDRGPAVSRICREKGFHGKPSSKYDTSFAVKLDKFMYPDEHSLDRHSDTFFALKGRKATRFMTYLFHGVHGDIEFEPADPDTVYFYRYRARYHPIVFQP